MATGSFSFNWNWKDFCGDNDNFAVWNGKYRDLDSCFQYLCLDSPVLVLIAVLSAYYHGLAQLETRRSSRDLCIIRCRYITTLLLAALPVVQIYIEELLFPGVLNPVDYLLASVQCVSWLVHFAFVLSLSHRHTNSLRGPVLISVLWSFNYILCFINVHSSYLMFIHPKSPPLWQSKIPYIFSIIHVTIQSLYLFSLLPEGESSPPISFGALASSHTQVLIYLTFLLYI